MSKPLIDGKKLNNMPSFTMPKMNNTEQNSKPESDNKPPTPRNNIQNNIKEDSKEEKIIENRKNIRRHSDKQPDINPTGNNAEAVVRDDLAGLDADSIFVELCVKEMWKNESSCLVCGKAFGTLKFINMKNCEFCGACVCDDHSKKKRPNPKNPSEFARVCDTCDEKHIRKNILQEFDERMKRREKEIVGLESKIKEQQVKINEVQTDYDNIMIQKARNDKNYSDQVTFLTNDIARIKEETKKCEKENALLTKDFTDTQKKTDELDVKIQEAHYEYETLKIQASTLTTQLDAVNQDINQIAKEMRDIERLIVNNKVGDHTPQMRGNGAIENVFSKSVTQIEGNFAEKYISFDSSYLSERKNHYDVQTLANRNSRKRSKREDQSASMSNACEVKCNIF